MNTGARACEFLQAYWRADLATALAQCTPGALIELARSLPLETPAPVEQVLPLIFSSVYPRFVDGRFDARIDATVADATRAAVEYRATGTLTNGRAFDCRYAAWFQFEGALIRHIRMYTDTRYVAEQLMS